ncbi:MAG: polysaccharide biosynthesis protein [Clostridiales bacterium]|nr:polysaccharide biosynthesis protein [Clostridiales bacterium]
MSKNNVLRGALTLTVSGIFVRILGFAYRIYLSRNLGPEGMGIFQLVIPVLFTSLTLVSAGIPLAVSRLTAQKRVMGDYIGLQRTLYTAIGLVVTSSLLICIALILNVNYISNTILKEPRTRGALLAIYPAIIITPLSAVFKGYFYGIKSFYPPAFSEIIEEIITVALAFWLLRLTREMDISARITAVALAVAAGDLVSLLYLHYSYYRLKDKNTLPAKISRAPFPLLDILKISGPIALIRLISSISTSIGSILIPQRLVKSGVAHSRAVSTLGILNGMVMPLLFAPFTFVGSLAVVMIPNLSEDLVKNDKAKIRSKISKAIFVTNLLALPFSAMMMALAEPMVIIFYDQIEAGSILRLMAFLAAVNALGFTLSSILNGLGKQNISAVYIFIGEIIEILSIIYLIPLPHLRIYGYITGFSLSSLAVLIMQFRAVCKATGLKIIWNEWLFKPVFAALLTTAISRLCYLWLLGNRFSLSLAFALSVFAGMLVYLSVLYLRGSITFLREAVFNRTKN